MRLGIKGKQVLGVTSIVGAVVVVAERAAPGARSRASASRRASARAELLAQRHLPPRARGRRRRRRSRIAALRADPGLRSILESSLYSKNVTYAAIVDVARHRRRARRSARSKGSRCRRAATSTRCSSRSPLVAAARDLLRPGAEPRVPRSRCCSATAEFGSIRIGVSTLLIRQRPRTRRCGPALVDGARRARRRGARRDAARAAAAAADSRHPQRPDAPRPRRVRRAARSRPGRRVRRARHVLQHRQRAAVGRSLADGRPGGQPRVGGRAPRGRRRDRQPDAASCCSPTRRCARCCRGARAGASLDDAACRADHPLRRLSEQTLVEPPVARAAVGDVPFARRDGERLVHDARRSTIRRASWSASCWSRATSST